MVRRPCASVSRACSRSAAPPARAGRLRREPSPAPGVDDPRGNRAECVDGAPESRRSLRTSPGVAARGTLMGNRGVLHDDARRIVAAWRTRRWITCALEFRGRRREVFTPRRYSELFFLDEATALSAGHRPCAECRRTRYEEFRSAWAAGQARESGSKPPGADDMDRVLHAERLESAPRRAALHSATRGAAGGIAGRGTRAGRASFSTAGCARGASSGYGPAFRVPARTRVRVLTPRSIVRSIRAGFAPAVHESAKGSARPGMLSARGGRRARRSTVARSPGR